MASSPFLQPAGHIRRLVLDHDRRDPCFGAKESRSHFGAQLFFGICHRAKRRRFGNRLARKALRMSTCMSQLMKKRCVKLFSSREQFARWHGVPAHNSVCRENIGVFRRPFYRGRHAYDPVCVEFQLTRRLGSEIIHYNAVATDRSRSARAVARVRRSGAPVSPLSVRCDSDIGCRTPCSRRASVRGRSGSKTRFDPDTRAGWFRSAARPSMRRLAPMASGCRICSMASMRRAWPPAHSTFPRRPAKRGTTPPRPQRRLHPGRSVRGFWKILRRSKRSNRTLEASR